MLKQVVAILTICMFSASAYAEPKIYPLAKGAKAPVAGVLLNDEAVAELMSDKKISVEKCELEKERAVKDRSIQLQFEIDKKDAEINACQKRYDEVVALKNDQIEFLSGELERVGDPHTEWFFIGGIAGGIFAGVGLTVLAGWALGQITPGVTQ